MCVHLGAVGMIYQRWVMIERSSLDWDISLCLFLFEERDLMEIKKLAGFIPFLSVAADVFCGTCLSIRAPLVLPHCASHFNLHCIHVEENPLLSLSHLTGDTSSATVPTALPLLWSLRRSFRPVHHSSLGCAYASMLTYGNLTC